jgi:serine/threonine protein phosphatase 1
MADMRQIAVGDIHGCAKTFRKLIWDELQLTSNDHLILLGDIIDRGPDSKGVIDEILNIKNRGFRVQILQGNHEEMMINASQSNESNDYWLRNGGQETLDSFGVKHVSEIPTSYLDFIRFTELYIETADTIFVHAGLNFNKSDPFSDYDSMKWIRKMEIDPSKIGNRAIVHGHVPAPLPLLLKVRKFNINIDAGCVYKDYPGLGNLLAYDVTNKKFYAVPNCE